MVNGPIEEEPVEIAAHGEHMGSYGPVSGDIVDPGHLQAVQYLPVSGGLGKPGKHSPTAEYFEPNFSPFATDLGGFAGYGAGPAGPIGFHNPIELLYGPPASIGKNPFQFGHGKPLQFGRPGGFGPMGPPPPPPHTAASSQSSTSSGYGQLLNSLFNVYSLGGSKNGKPSSSSGSGSKGIGSYFNNVGFDLFKVTTIVFFSRSTWPLPMTCSSFSSSPSIDFNRDTRRCRRRT